MRARARSCGAVFWNRRTLVLAYLVLMGDQTVSSDDSTPAAEFICGQIASADAAWHDGSEELHR